MERLIANLRSPGVAWMLVFIWMSVIFAFSNQAHSGTFTEHYLGGLNVPVRKFAHLCEYAILALFMRNALESTFLRLRDNSLLSGALTFAGCLFYALSDEWHQSMVPGRSATISDVAVDTTGALIGLCVFVLIRTIVVSRYRQQ